MCADCACHLCSECEWTQMCVSLCVNEGFQAFKSNCPAQKSHCDLTAGHTCLHTHTHIPVLFNIQGQELPAIVNKKCEGKVLKPGRSAALKPD